MTETTEYLHKTQPSRLAMLVDGPTPDEAKTVSEHFPYRVALMAADPRL